MAKAAVPPERKERKKASKPSKKAKGASSPKRGDYGLLAKFAWLLLILACGLALVPVLGFISWLVAAPILAATLILAIIVMYRGGSIQGGILLALSVVGVPLFIYFAPAISSTTGFAALISTFGKTAESGAEVKSKQSASNAGARQRSAPSTGPKRQAAKPPEKRNESVRVKFDPLAERNAD